MNKLEVGMWVRTKHYGIFKILNVEKVGKTIFFKKAQGIDVEVANKNNPIEEEIIGEPSFNPIDLIEVGDIVELFMEDDIDGEDTNVFELVAITDDKKELGVFNSDFQIEFFSIENLRGIVTKEQFEGVKYEIE